MSCNRCGKDDVDSIEVGKDSYPLCKRCCDTFWRRFQTFMASGSRKCKSCQAPIKSRRL
jgi:transposase-like protein